MNDKELIELGRSATKKRQKVYIGGGIALIVWGIVMFIIGFTSKSKDVYQYVAGGLLLAGGGALIALFFVSNKNILDDDKMLETGKKEQERVKTSLEPDFNFNKEFINDKNKIKVWLNTTTKEIQLVYPNTKNGHKGLGWKKCEKTKILNVNMLNNIEFFHDVKEIERIQGGTYHGDSYSGTDVTVTTDDYHYYAIELKFNDLDYPFVDLYFGHDEDQAKTIYETIKLLKNGNEE